jgi:hypothetical protein
VGVTAVLSTGGSLRRAPERVGVQLLVGSAAVVKTVSGLLSLAPSEVTADASCTVPAGDGVTRVPVELGALATLTVPLPGSARLDGIPLGAQCELVESGDVGEFGEVRRDPEGAQQVDILVAGSSSDPVPAAQLVTIDNHYAPREPATGTLSSTGVDSGQFIGFGSLVLAAFAAGAALLAIDRRRRARG